MLVKGHSNGAVLQVDYEGFSGVVATIIGGGNEPISLPPDVKGFRIHNRTQLWLTVRVFNVFSPQEEHKTIILTARQILWFDASAGVRFQESGWMRFDAYQNVVHGKSVEEVSEIVAREGRFEALKEISADPIESITVAYVLAEAEPTE